MAKWDWLKKTALFLTGVGALNWGLVQWANFNLVTWLQGLAMGYLPSWVVYSAVGLSGTYVLLEMTGIWKAVKKKLK